MVVLKRLSEKKKKAVTDGALRCLSFIVAAETVVPFEIVADREFVRAERLSATDTAGFLLLMVV